MKLVTAEQMRGLDSAAINTFKVPSLELMENAGRRTVEIMLEEYGDPQGKKTAIFVGPGNNGGDGLVIARLLSARLAKPTVIMLVSPERLKGDSSVNYEKLREFPVTICSVDNGKSLQQCVANLADCWTVVDAMFGTGLTRELGGIFAAAVELINAAPCPVTAVDIPSGLDADTVNAAGFGCGLELTDELLDALGEPGLCP